MKPTKVYKKSDTDEQFRLLKNEQPTIEHVSRVIDEEALVYCKGKVVAIYKKMPFDVEDLRKACNRLRFSSKKRNNGIVTNTINLNASPRNPRQDNRCWKSLLRRHQPGMHELFLQAGWLISRQYLKYFRRQFADQTKTIYSGSKKVDKSYLIPRTPFTGGVINKDSAIGYHFDAANRSGGISCMLIFKKNQAGGELILPQLDIGFACQDGYMLLFDGKTYLHGVTPILQHPNLKGYRYTIVYYNNAGMHLCLPPDEEELHYQQHLEKQSDKKRNNLKNK